jgi:hypothetical protein
MAQLTKQLVRSGDFPWWNPLNGLGVPLAANPHAGVYDPTNWISWMFPPGLQWDVHLLLAYFLGSLGTYFLVRVLGCSVVAATVSSIAFTGIGHFVTYGNHPNPAITLCALPWILASSFLVLKSSRLLPMLCLGIAIYWCIAAGFPETTLGCAIVSFAFIAVVLARMDVRRLVGIGRMTIGVSIGLLFSAPYLLGLAEFISVSYSTHAPGMRNSFNLEPRQALPTWFLPTFFGRPYSQFLNNAFLGVRGWVGMTVGLLALLGASVKNSKRALVGAGFFFMTPIFILMYAYTNWLGEMVRNLPGIEQVVPAWFLPIAEFSLVIAAAFGVDGLIQKTIEFKKFFRWSIVPVILFVYGFKETRKVLAQIPMESLIESIRRPLLIVVTLIAVLLATRLLKNQKIARYLIASICIASTVIELSIYRDQNDLPDRRYPYSTTEWLHSLNTNPQFKTSDRVFGELAVNFPSTSAAIGVRDIRVLDALYVERYWNFIKLFLQPTAKTRFAGGPFSENEEPLHSSIPINLMARVLRVDWLLGGGPPDHQPFAMNNYLRYASIGNQPAPPDNRKCVAEGLKKMCGLIANPTLNYVIPTTSTQKQIKVSFGIDTEDITSKIAGSVTFQISAIDKTNEKIATVLRTKISLNKDKNPWKTVSIAGSPAGTTSLLLETFTEGNLFSRQGLWNSLEVDGDALLAVEKVASLESEAVEIYRFRQKSPIAFMVHNVSVEPSYEKSVQWLVENSSQHTDGRLIPVFNPFDAGVVESTRIKRLRFQPCKPESLLNEKTRANGQISFTVETNCAGLLVVSEGFYPGWRVKVNGVEQETLPFDSALISTIVEAGTSDIELFYRPTYLYRAIMSIALGLMLVLALLVFHLKGKLKNSSQNSLRSRPW